MLGGEELSSFKEGKSVQTPRDTVQEGNIEVDVQWIFVEWMNKWMAPNFIETNGKWEEIVFGDYKGVSW